MTITNPASSRLLRIVELTETILLHLDFLDLYRVYKSSSYLQSIIHSSPALSQTLFLERNTIHDTSNGADDHTASSYTALNRTLNPIISTYFPTSTAFTTAFTAAFTNSISNHRITPASITSTHDSKQQHGNTTTNHTLPASWRRMYATNPPVSRITIYGERLLVIKNTTGVKLSQVADTVLNGIQEAAGRHWYLLPPENEDVKPPRGFDVLWRLEDEVVVVSLL